MSASDRLVTVGSVVVGLGGALGVAYYIYTLENSLSFWSWPSITALIATGIGLFCLVKGLFRRESPTEGLRQRGGKRSTNYQAGRDMTIGRSDDASR